MHSPHTPTGTARRWRWLQQTLSPPAPLIHRVSVWCMCERENVYAFVPQHWLELGHAATLQYVGPHTGQQLRSAQERHCTQHTVCINNSSFASLKLCCAALIWLRFGLSYIAHTQANTPFTPAALHFLSLTLVPGWCTNPFVSRRENQKWIKRRMAASDAGWKKRAPTIECTRNITKSLGGSTGF